MNFEQELNNFLEELRQDGILVDANLVGVSEEKRTGTAIGRFLYDDDIVRERHIALYEEDGVLVWKTLEVVQ